MSEEDLIKVITYKLNVKDTDVYAPILYEEIQALLDLYNKEKEKNKELEEIKQKKLDKYLYKNQWICKDLAENYIPKSKVREVLDTKYIAMFEGDTEFPDDATIMKTVKYVKVSDLEELLQEGDK